MTLLEFSKEFDVLYNNIMSNKSIGITEYEKSVFLTRTQEELVISLYKGNSISDSAFEETEDNRRYISHLIATSSINTKEEGCIGVSENSQFFKLPEKVLYITYESATIDNPENKCNNTVTIPVVPTTQDKYNKIRRNPFRNTNERRALRLDYSKDIVEIISKYSISKYNIKYIKVPPPIITEDLPEGITINGINMKSESILPSILHRYIIEGAVKKAITTWANNSI